MDRFECFLVLYLDKTQSPPIPVRAKFCSESAGSLTVDHSRFATVDVMSWSDKTYDAAQKGAEAYVRGYPLYAWILPFLGSRNPLLEPLGDISDVDLQRRLEEEEARAGTWMAAASLTQTEVKRRAK